MIALPFRLQTIIRTSLLLGLFHFVLLSSSSTALAQRVVYGKIIDADGQPIEGLKVKAWDDDDVPNGDVLDGNGDFVPPHQDPDDFMGEDVTDFFGNYRITYPRPGRWPNNPGHWDFSLDHEHDTRWRPDIYIEVLAPTDGFCPYSGSSIGPTWRHVEYFPPHAYVNWKVRDDLRIDRTVSEYFDTRCLTFSPLLPLMASYGGELRGVVDMHTHPMAHLGFGGKIFHGAPDIGSLMLDGTAYCDGNNFRATKMEEALSNCYYTHFPKALTGGTNPCGNDVRFGTITAMELVKGAQSHHNSTGFKVFPVWPRYNDMTHQQMWIDWVHRAFRGGLRVMVALAVNSRTLATVVDGTPPFDDKNSGDLQIDEIKGLAARHAFMEIAYNPAQLRQIVGSGKLAIVIGVELDDLGNFLGDPIIKGDENVSPEQIQKEIQRLHAQGVRYIFPVHVIDNHFGGTAIYQSMFAFANGFQKGEYWDIGCADAESGITFRYEQDVVKEIFKTLTGFDQPTPPCQAGHINNRSLTDLGVIAIEEMMRLGMMIDIDHMSQKTADEALSLAECYGYPVNSGHNGLRGSVPGEVSENTRTLKQYKRIVSLGGMAGVGWSGSKNAGGFRIAFQEVAMAMNGRNLALGTDINGLVVGPEPPAGNPVSYGLRFPMARTGLKKWNYNLEGVAHYGLMPDFFVHLQELGADAELNQLFEGAEAFAQMWECADQIRDRLPAALVAAW